MPQPACAAGSPLPAIVISPSTKSVGCAHPGSAADSSAAGSGGVTAAAKSRGEPSVVDAPERPVLRRRADAIAPAAAVVAARRGERRARDLLGIQAVGAALRRIAPDRQRARQRFGGVLVAETREIVRRRHGAGGRGVGGFRGESVGGHAHLQPRVPLGASARTDDDSPAALPFARGSSASATCHVGGACCGAATPRLVDVRRAQCLPCIHNRVIMPRSNTNSAGASLSRHRFPDRRVRRARPC